MAPIPYRSFIGLTGESPNNHYYYNIISFVVFGIQEMQIVLTLILIEFQLQVLLVTSSIRVNQRKAFLLTFQLLDDDLPGNHE